MKASEGAMEDKSVIKKIR